MPATRLLEIWLPPDARRNWQDRSALPRKDIHSLHTNRHSRRGQCPRNQTTTTSDPSLPPPLFRGSQMSRRRGCDTVHCPAHAVDRVRECFPKRLRETAFVL